MSLIDRILGRDENEPTAAAAQQPRQPPRAPQTADEQAVARYRYLLQTAPPDAIEQAHAEAFGKLSPDQRRLALQQLSQNVPASEQAGATDDPRSLARLATRAEMRQPGFMERTFGGMSLGGGMGMGGGIGMGGLLAGGFLSSLAGGFVGSAIAQSFFDNDGGSTTNNYYGDNGNNEAGADNAGGDAGDTSSFNLDDPGSGDTMADAGGGDFGGDF